ncbi:protein of unknown function [Desulfosporosinus hippei DSM 8344]|uniref:DUF1963 domain-containing protein n=2 Tax=Desulfosporosinus TaxID=79206 RepID=A0A1G8KSW1_9FIRM|nr:protein of unknown function [Desulfosporosinus hippei DSM 8344]
MNFNLKIFEGTDSIKFGMTSEEIQSILKIKSTFFKESEVALYQIENYNDICQVHYEASEDGQIVSAAFRFSAPSVFLDNIQLIGEEAGKVEDLFKLKFKDYEISDHCFVSHKSEIFITLNFGKILTVYITRKGYVEKQKRFYEKALSQSTSLIEKKAKVITTKEEKYCVIRFSPLGKEYHQAWDEAYHEQLYKEYSIDKPLYQMKSELESEYDDYKKIDIPIGISRIGGPVVDLPENLKYPEGYSFLAQIDLALFSKHDKLGLLPDRGYLYFFVKDGDKGLVFYENVEKDKLKRINKEHEDWYFAGRIIGDIWFENELISSRYKIDDNGLTVWDELAGEETSKIYGIFTNVQATENEIKKMMKNKILLLQVGSDFLGTGVQCVYIEEDNLRSMDFSQCIFDYSQT